MRELEIRSEPVGGSSLARAVAEGTLPHGFAAVPPRGVDDWAARMQAHARSGEWLEKLRPALGAESPALDRLRRVARAGGVVVTTGQQPGLFGGPLYTWYKALSARALADELEKATGIPCAPLFWAATDDADLAEAATTAIVRDGKVETLRLAHPDPHASRAPLAEVPLGDVGDALRSLESAAGATLNPGALALARETFREDRTVGAAYVELLRSVLGRYEIAVLDAADPAVANAARPILRDALRRADRIATALRERDRELAELGHTPQVANVAGLSLVFERTRDDRQRVRMSDAARLAEASEHAILGPNVLLRPVVERSIVPTVAYVAGPGELAYFAQTGAVAAALEVDPPLAVPRWSGTIIEPHVARLLERLHLRPEEASDPDAVMGRLAREGLAPEIAQRLHAMRAALDDGMDSLQAALAAGSPPLLEPHVIEGHRRILQRRLDRLERRIIARQKRRETDLERSVRAIHAALHPGGKRQERVLNLLPLLARHGSSLLDLVLAHAREHAAQLVRHTAGSPAPA